MDIKSTYYKPSERDHFSKTFGVLALAKSAKQYKGFRYAPYGVWTTTGLRKVNIEKKKMDPENGYAITNGQLSAARYRDLQTRRPTDEEMGIIEKMPPGGIVPVIVGREIGDAGGVIAGNSPMNMFLKAAQKIGQIGKLSTNIPNIPIQQTTQAPVTPNQPMNQTPQTSNSDTQDIVPTGPVPDYLRTFNQLGPEDQSLETMNTLSNQILTIDSGKAADLETSLENALEKIDKKDVVANENPQSMFEEPEPVVLPGRPKSPSERLHLGRQDVYEQLVKIQHENRLNDLGLADHAKDIGKQEPPLSTDDKEYRFVIKHDGRTSMKRTKEYLKGLGFHINHMTDDNTYHVEYHGEWSDKKSTWDRLKKFGYQIEPYSTRHEMEHKTNKHLEESKTGSLTALKHVRFQRPQQGILG